MISTGIQLTIFKLWPVSGATGKGKPCTSTGKNLPISIFTSILKKSQRACENIHKRSLPIHENVRESLNGATDSYRLPKTSSKNRLDLISVARASQKNQHVLDGSTFMVDFRMLTTGTIEEKIFQRQVLKQSLSGTVVDARESTQAHFTKDELKVLESLTISQLDTNQ